MEYKQTNRMCYWIYYCFVLTMLFLPHSGSACSYIDRVSSIRMPDFQRQILIYQDTLAIVAEHAETLGFTIVNVADPASPQIVATVNNVTTYNYLLSMALDSNILYVGTDIRQIPDSSSGIMTVGLVSRYDLSDPLNPVWISEIDVTGAAWKLSAHNDQVFVAMRGSLSGSGFVRVDFSNASSPVEVGFDAWENTVLLRENRPFDIASDASGRYTYLASGDSGLLVYDNALLPQSGQVASLKLTTGVGDHTATAVSVQGDRLLVTGAPAFSQPPGGSLSYYDISNPASPVRIGLRSIDGGNGKLSDQYMLWGDGSSVFIEDTVNHSEPSWFGRETLPLGIHVDFQRSGDYIFAITRFLDSLQVYRFTAIPRPPIFDPIATQFVNEAQHLEFIVRVFDLDDCDVAVDSVQTLPPNFGLNYFIGGPMADSIRITADPDWTQAGSYDLNFVATDIDDTTYYTVTVVVNDRTPLYNPPVDYSYPDNVSGPHGITAADFDNDGDIDIAETSSSWISGNNYTGLLRILDNDSTGLYTLIKEDTLPHKPAAPVSGDLNGDSIPDIVIAYYDFNNIPGYDSVAVMINNGDGTFAPQVLYLAGPAARYVHLFDADGDSDLDIAVRDFGDSTIAILLNSGTGTFAAPTFFPAAGQAQAIASADIDGDNDQDLLIPSRRLFPWKPELQIYLNDGFGAFTLDTAFVSPRTIYDVKTGDMDGDSDIDFVMSRDDTITVMLNDGTGRFPSRHEYLTSRFSYFLQLVDVDGNGSLDVLSGTDQNGEVDVLQNNSDGTLQQAVSYTVGQGLQGLNAADVDGDTDIDVIVANQSVRGVQILLNNTLLSNHAPAFQALNAGDLSVIEGDTLAITIQANDADGHIPTLSASGLPTGAILSDNNNGTANLFFVPGANQAGRYVFSLFASDGLEITQQDLVMVVFNGDGLFNRPVDYVLSGTPTGVLTADLDSDNDRDIAVSTVTPHAVEIWTNDGAAAFQFLGSNGLSGPPAAIAAGDFDGDLDIDLALVSDSANILDVLLNNGGGSFAAPVIYPTGGNSVVAADFDLDNDIDLAIARADSTAGVYLLKNDSNGVFSPGVWHYAGASPVDMIGGDFDGNGSVDLAVADASTGHVWILLSNGSGFSTAVPYSAGRQLATITSADLDADSDIDIIVSSVVYDTVSVLLNDGNGKFSLNWQGDFGYNPGDIYAGILKPNDSISLVGVGDIFEGNQYVTAVSHRLSNGSYQTDFSTDLYWCAGKPVAITGDRLDNDNDDDLIIIQSQGQRITILTGASDVSVDVEENESLTIPMTFELSQNYPNPFNPSTVIRFALPRRSDVVLEIFNILGQRVETLINETLPAGTFTVEWNGNNISGKAVATGVYFYRLQAGERIETKKMLLLK